MEGFGSEGHDTEIVVARDDVVLPQVLDQRGQIVVEAGHIAFRNPGENEGATTIVALVESAR